MSNEQSINNFERKIGDGKANPKYVDLLEEDKPIAGQKFTCVSFVSPENILRRKDIFCFEQFVKQWGLNKSVEKFWTYNRCLNHLFDLRKNYIKTEHGRTLNEFYENV